MFLGQMACPKCGGAKTVKRAQPEHGFCGTKKCRTGIFVLIVCYVPFYFAFLNIYFLLHIVVIMAANNHKTQLIILKELSWVNIFAAVFMLEWNKAEIIRLFCVFFCKNDIIIDTEMVKMINSIIKINPFW